MAKRKRKAGAVYDPNLLLQKTRMRTEEAASLLEVAPRTVRRYMADGKLDYVLTPGGARRPLTASVKRYLDPHERP